MGYLYEYGTAFTKSLKKNIDIQLERVENKRASMIVIDGAVGTGKTTLAVEIMDYINSKTGKDKVILNPKEHPQIALGGKEFIGCFNKCYKEGYKVLTYDEGGDFSKRGAITKLNRTLNRAFETYRGFKILVIICLPNFSILDSLLFENEIPRLLVHITDRSKYQGEYFLYSLSQMNWLRYWFNKLNVATRKKAFSYVLPNAKGHFKNLPPMREKELDKLSTAGKSKVWKETEIQLEGLYSYKELAKALNITHQHVRTKVNKLKIKHVRMIDRVKYFDKSVFDKLNDTLRKDKNTR